VHPDRAAELAAYWFKRWPEASKRELGDNFRKSGRGVIGSGYGWSFIHNFSYWGPLLAVELLLEKGCETGIPDQSSGKCPLHLAVMRNREDIVQVLLEKGADINLKSKSGDTPLMLATVHNHATIVKILLYWGADIEARDNAGSTPWGWVKWRPGRKEVKQLLEQAKKRNATTPRGLA